MEKAGVAVEIFGQQYVLKSGFPEEQVREVANYVDGKMKEVAEGTRTVDTLHLAILTALNIAQDYLQEQKGREELLQRLQENTERLNEFIASHMS